VAVRHKTVNIVSEGKGPWLLVPRSAVWGDVHRSATTWRHRSWLIEANPTQVRGAHSGAAEHNEVDAAALSSVMFGRIWNAT